VDAYLIKNQKRTRILRWIGSLGALALLIYLFQRQGWEEIRNAFQQVSSGRFALALGLVFVSRFAVIGRWHALLSAAENVTLGQTIRLTFAGMFATNFLPTTVGGDVVRLAGAIQLNIDGAFAAASLIVDRLIGMFGMVLALPFGARPLAAWFEAAGTHPGDLAAGLSFPMFGRVKRGLLGLFRRVLHALRVWSGHPKSLLTSFGFTLVHMSCLFGIILLLLSDLGEQLSFGMVAGLWSFVYFVTLIPISINGYGVQELSIALIFSEVGGISLQSGLTVSVLLRSLMILGSLPGVAFLPGILAGEARNKEPVH
jgi:uncharacterized membrane protein YbhN (UPF0104 family)